MQSPSHGTKGLPQAKAPSHDKRVALPYSRTLWLRPHEGRQTGLPEGGRDHRKVEHGSLRQAYAFARANVKKTLKLKPILKKNQMHYTRKKKKDQYYCNGDEFGAW